MSAMFTCRGSTVGVCTTAAFQTITMVSISASWHWLEAHDRVQELAAPYTALIRGSLMPFKQLLSSHSINMVGHTALGPDRETPYSSTFPVCEGGVFFYKVGST